MVAQLFPENADAMLSGEVGTRLRNAQGGAAGDEGGEGGGSAGAGKKKAGAPKAIVEISAANWEEVCPPR